MYPALKNREDKHHQQSVTYIMTQIRIDAQCMLESAAM